MEGGKADGVPSLWRSISCYPTNHVPNCVLPELTEIDMELFTEYCFWHSRRGTGDVRTEALRNPTRQIASESRLLMPQAVFPNSPIDEPCRKTGI